MHALQRFLNCAGFTVSAVGAGAPGNETDVFATRTREAVIAFQEYYAAEILIPAGVPNGTGIFGEFSKSQAHLLMRQ